MKILRIALLLLLLTIPASVPLQAQPGTATDQAAPTLTPEDSVHDMVNKVRENIFLFGTIYREINQNYVDQVDPEEFIKAGIDGMLSTLDPYTEYFEPDETDDLNIMTKGKYGGIGIQIGLRGPDRTLTIIAPIEGTPGWKLGLQPGDQIIEIEGQSTKGFTTFDAAKLMRGTPGTVVNITVRRLGVDDPIDYSIERAIIPVVDISYSGFIQPGIGFIRLTRFSRNAGDQVRTAIDSLEQLGMKGLILDLRGNPGGLLPEAVNVAENFLMPGDPIVSTRGRVPTSNREFVAEKEPSLDPSIPLVVLVNEGSASASEIVAGAIQDLDRGVIVGKTTFGKGLVQSVIPFRNRKRGGKGETSLKLTTAKYYTPSGRLIQKIDYFTDNNVLILDSTLSEDGDTHYFTRNGREVNAHGGIDPDFEVDFPEVGIAVIELWRQGKFFDFASWYKGEHPDLDTWEVTDEMYAEFLNRLAEEDFTFETDTERNLAKIREEAERFNYGEEFLQTLDKLDELARSTHEVMLEEEKDQIKQRIEVELATLIGGSSARVEASLAFDPQTKKAVEVLQSDNVYAVTLTDGAPGKKDAEASGTGNPE